MDIEIDINLIREYAYNAAIAIAVLLVIWLVLYLIDKYTKLVKSRLLNLKLRSIKIFGLEIINVGKQEFIITTAVNAIQVILSLVFLYLSLVLILGEIPATEDIAIQLVTLIFEPLQSLFTSFLGYLPDLFNIFITILIANYLIKAINFITKGVVAGNFKFPGFHPRTARTTAGIFTFLIYILTIILIMPSMPGYESLAFRGIATFLGALITIGGSSVIANYMAGIVLTYMLAFEKNDWVTIDEVSGKVISSGTFAVQLISYKEETVSIPNSKVLGSVIRNYRTGEDKPMILHTDISIGYDVPWKKVNELLVDAAKKTEFLDKEKEPFVLQKKLDDFYIVYELNVFLNDPASKPKAHSSLNSNILDVFNESKIEIMSPHYRAERDGSPSTIAE